MYSVGIFFYWSKRNDDALAVLQEVTERFPESSDASLAWCGMGQVHGSARQKEKMIAALERGTAKLPAPAEVGDFGSGSLNFACETLGQHYIDTAQWKKGAKIYTGWQPSVMCGTCQEEMERIRENGILLCHLQLGRRDKAAEQAWISLTRTGLVENDLFPFLLVRLYEEADQRADLQALARDLENRAREEFAADPKQLHRLQTIRQQTAMLAEAIALVDDPRWTERLAVFRDAAVPGEERTRGVLRQVAAWLLIREPKTTVALLRDAVDGDDEQSRRLVEVLAAIDSPAARKSLVALAAEGGLKQQQMVCGIINTRVKEPEALIAQIVARVPQPRKKMTTSHAGPAPIAFEFYQTWSKPKAGSLPKSLPADLFAKDKP